MKRPSPAAIAARVFAATPERRLALLRAAWPVAVGPDLARRSEVVALDGAVLRVRVPDAGWRRGLLRMRSALLTRLREITGVAAPRAIGFVEGHVQRLDETSTTVRPVAPAPPPPAVVTAADAIADPEVRARFVDTAARYLGRFRPVETAPEEPDV